MRRRLTTTATDLRSPTGRRRHHPSYEKLNSIGWRAVEAEGRLSGSGWAKEQKWALEMGLPGAESLTDRTILPSPGASCPTSPASTPS